MKVKRKLKISKLIGRIVLFTLLGVIILVLAIFFFDRYQASTVDVDNKYSDEYWQRETLDDFTYYADAVKNVEKYNISSKEYVAPWTAVGKTATKLSWPEKLDYARYKEEIDYIGASLGTEQKKILANAKYSVQKKYEEFANDVESWVSEYIGFKLSKLDGISITKSAYEYAVDFGFVGSEDDLVAALRVAADAEKIMDELSDCGFVFDKDDLNYMTLEKAIIEDTTFFAKVVAPSADYLELAAKLAELESNIAYQNELKANLLSWEDYYKTVLLGYGGLATGYANKPVLTVAASIGGTYELWFNVNTTSFKINYVDELGVLKQSWSAIPDDNVTKDGFTTSKEVQELQKSPLVVYYSGSKGNTVVYRTYNFSITDKDSQTGNKLTPNFAFKIDEENKTLTVWYRLEKRGISYVDIPRFLSETKMKELFARNAALVDSGENIPDLRVADANDTEHYNDKDPNFKKVKEARLRLLQGYYEKVLSTNTANEKGYDYYEMGNGTYKALSGDTLNNLYAYLYDWCGYTYEDLLEDNEEFGQEVGYSKASFDVAIEYQLTENGLVATIPGNSIIENGGFDITNIDILPYFTSSVYGTEGYTVIPDGSGVVLEHDNGNLGYSKYQKRVYTTDLTNTPAVNEGDYEDLMFPMYGVINTGTSSGMLVYASKCGAQLELTADISLKSSLYNTNSFSVYLRESKTFKLGVYGKSTITKWTADRVRDDIVLNYEILGEDELSYSSLAARYRERLIEMYGIKDHDKSTTPTLDLDIIGSYEYKDNFIGIPYTAKGCLTTLDQMEEIVDTFTSYGIKKINVEYLGWRKTNLANYSFKYLRPSSLIGKVSDFQDMLAENSSDVAVYPYVNFGEISKFQESFGYTHYAAHGADGDYAKRRPYDLNSNVFDKTKSWIYALSPRYYLAFAEVLTKNYLKVTDNSSYLAIDELGSVLTADYKRNNVVFKVGAQKIQVQTLQYFKENGVSNLTLYNPYDYALAYATTIKEVPYSGTGYEILDYSIPFYQLVINGLIDYSGESINANSEKGLTEHIMRIIETGSNISFTFTYDSSEELLQTDYNNYYYTLYTDWVNDVNTVYNTVNNLGIYRGQLIAHERVNNNIYKVTYKIGSSNTYIYLNYTRNDYTAADGTFVPAKNYAVAA